MKKVWYILKELGFLIRKEKLFFLAPIFIILALLAFLVYTIGPATILTFIYAGV